MLELNFGGNRNVIDESDKMGRGKTRCKKVYWQRKEDDVPGKFWGEND